MIQVNAWLPTTHLLGKRIKNRFFGPLLASEENGENIGHANFVMELDERSPGYTKLDDKSSPFLIKKSFLYAPEAAVGKAGMYYQRKTLKSVQVTHSFWPKDRPSTRELAHGFFNFLHLAPKNKGVKPEISHHDSDMIREEEGNASTHVIEHPSYKASMQKIDDDKKRNLDETVNIWNLDSDLDNKKIVEEKLKHLMEKQDTLIALHTQLGNCSRVELGVLNEKKDALANSLMENSQKTIFLTKKLNYLKKILNSDVAIFAEMERTNQKLSELQKEQVNLSQEQSDLEKHTEQVQRVSQEQLQKNQQDIEQVNKEISVFQIQLQELNARLQNRDEKTIALLKSDVQERADFLSRKEFFLKNSNKTEGRHPDHSINLPTSESGLRYFVNELEVIKAMQNESNENYCLIQNNCAKSVKRCLLAGIQHLKKELKENGVPSSFFKFQPIETTNGVYKWARRLEHELVKLNTSLELNEGPLSLGYQ